MTMMTVALKKMTTINQTRPGQTEALYAHVIACECVCLLRRTRNSMMSRLYTERNDKKTSDLTGKKTSNSIV